MRLQDIYLLDCAFQNSILLTWSIRRLYCSKEGIRVYESPGDTHIFSTKGRAVADLAHLFTLSPIKHHHCCCHRVLFRLMSPKLILCSINLHKYVCSADQIGSLVLTKARRAATQHSSPFTRCRPCSFISHCHQWCSLVPAKLLHIIKCCFY